MRIRIKTTVLTLMLLVLWPAASLAQDWVVEKVSHPAYFTTDSKNWFPISRGMHMPQASWIHTGRRGKLLLRRGEELINYSPNTLAALISQEADGSKTLLRQEFGDLLLDVETRDQKHLTVKTPYLAAVVKGTRFSVSVDDDEASVSVQEGVVDVSASDGGGTVGVGPGNTASVSGANPSGVSVAASQSDASKSGHSGKGGKGDGDYHQVGRGNANGNGNGNSNGNGNGIGNGYGGGNGINGSANGGK